MADRTVLTIRLTDTNQVLVDGPINDKVLCYGLLETAKDAIRDHIAVATHSSKIVVPPIAMNGH